VNGSQLNGFLVIGSQIQKDQTPKDRTYTSLVREVPALGSQGNGHQASGYLDTGYPMNRFRVLLQRNPSQALVVPGTQGSGYLIQNPTHSPTHNPSQALVAPGFQDSGYLIQTPTHRPMSQTLVLPHASLAALLNSQI
jgi:hypothetical protein